MNSAYGHYVQFSFNLIAGKNDNPSKLIVTLKGEVKDAQPNMAGTYVLEPKPENGKSHWLQYDGSNAIWYDSKYGDWNIGHQDNLGSAKASIYSVEDVAGPQVATTWQYLNGKQFIPSDDIFVDTFVEPGTGLLLIGLLHDLFGHIREHF